MKRARVVPAYHEAGSLLEFLIMRTLGILLICCVCAAADEDRSEKIERDVCATSASDSTDQDSPGRW